MIGKDSVALLKRYFASGVTRLRKIWVDGGYEAQWLRDWVRGLKQTHKIDLEVVEHTGKGFQVVQAALESGTDPGLAAQ